MHCSHTQQALSSQLTLVYNIESKHNTELVQSQSVALSSLSAPVFTDRTDSYHRRLSYTVMTKGGGFIDNKKARLIRLCLQSA